MDCNELMSQCRYNMLKVIVTMYLLTLLSKDNEFIKQTILGGRVGLSHNAMCCLAGYTYYNKHRNHLGLLSSDPCSGALDVYEQPPSTNTLIKRIQMAIASIKSYITFNCKHTVFLGKVQEGQNKVHCLQKNGKHG